MIHDSGPWKDALISDARRLKRLMKRTLPNEGFDDAAMLKAERIVLLGAYTMRKLWDSRKLSTSWNEARLPCVKYNLKEDIPDLISRDELEYYYNFAQPLDTTMKPEEFCSRIVHSFVLVLSVNEDYRIDGLYFTSDTMRRHALWYLSLGTIAKLFQMTGNDYPRHVSFIRVEDGNVLYWGGDGEPPEGWLEAARARSKRAYDEGR